jgi:hypothetical protein
MCYLSHHIWLVWSIDFNMNVMGLIFFNLRNKAIWTHFFIPKINTRGSNVKNIHYNARGKLK